MNKKITMVILAILAIAVGMAAYAMSSSDFMAFQDAPITEQQDGAASDAPLQASNLLTKVSDENGVTVTVTPTLVSPDAAQWKFDVTMSTHSVELGSYDLTKMATLIDAAGKTYIPVSWQPDATEGHHVGGVLTFDRPRAMTSVITMNIAGIGGESERTYVWNIAP